jgi:signal transduction histidine kinase
LAYNVSSTHPKNEHKDRNQGDEKKSEVDFTIDDPRGRFRLSFRAKLWLAVFGTILPVFILGIWLLKEHSTVLFAAGLLSFLLGIILTYWATRPIHELSMRAKSLAGMTSDKRRFFGLVSTDQSWDEAMAKALDEIERSLSEIQAMYKIGQLVTSDQGLEPILGRVIEEAVRLLNADAGIIGLWDAEKQVFQDVVACNMPIAFPGRKFGARDSFTSQVAITGRVIFIDDYRNYPYRINELERFNFHGTLGAPLIVQGESKGALTVLSTDPSRRFTYRDGQLLATFANQAGAALEKIRLYQIALDQLEELRRAKEQLAEERGELARAFSNMVQVQEYERARIAADIHDGVVQSMVGGLYEIQAAMLQLPEAPENVRVKQERVRMRLQEAILELRRVIYNLRPLTLDRSGLAPAVEQMAEDFNQVANLRPEVKILGNPYRFSSQAETAAYRIIQESLNNAYKHAQATDVEVEMRFSTDLIEITVADNGKGFPLDASRSENGERMGLIGMHDRAISVGGVININSVEGEGTEIAVAIPRLPPDAQQQDDRVRE